MKNKTCTDCLHFTHYSDGDPDGRCDEGFGTFGTHTRGDESACPAFLGRDIHMISTRQLDSIETALQAAKYRLMRHLYGTDILDQALLIINHVRKNKAE